MSMTVKYLKELLSKFPDEAEVKIAVGENGQDIEIDDKSFSEEKNVLSLWSFDETAYVPAPSAGEECCDGPCECSEDDNA